MLRHESECFKKRSYFTETKARWIAKRALESRGRRLRVYRCSYCYQWHLTKKLKERT